MGQHDPSSSLPRTGFVSFDDPHRHEAGWAARAGEAPRRIRGSQDLPSDTVWWTNLTFELMHQSGLGRHARFRRNDFLRLRPEQILRDWQLQDAEIPVQVQFLATQIDRVLHLTQRLAPLPRLPLDTLRAGLREEMLPPDPVLPAALGEAVQDAVQEYVSCERQVSRQMGGRRSVAFRLPPVEHAQAVLHTPLPTGDWRRLTARQLPGPADASAWMQAQATPVLVKATLLHIEPPFGQLINHGGGVGRRKRREGARLRSYAPSRQWMTAREFLSLAAFGELRIEAVWQAAGLGSLANVCPALRPADHLSYSVGLLLENLWTGAAMALMDSPGAAPIAVRQAFLRTEDRVRCLMAAASLHQAGIEIAGFGVGHIYGFVPEDTPDEVLFTAARQAGVLPPLLSLPEAPVPAQPDATTLLQTLHARGHHAALQALDAQALT